MLRFAIFISIAAALVPLFDQGTLWQFTLDPSRRLAVAAYALGHATLAGTILLQLRSLERPALTTTRALAKLALVALLGATLVGLIAADGQAFIEIVMGDAAPGALFIIGAALVLRALWRTFTDTNNSLLEATATETGEMTWRNVSVAVAAVLPALVLLQLMYISFVGTWNTADAFLSYAVQAQDWAQQDWQQPIRYAVWKFDNWVIYAILGATLVVWIVLEKLLVHPKKSQASEDAP